ncbi:hypothetical protein EDB83DRAFT_2324480 [Lactarius deliciosus]|nr:hypothetical protein EDB83DRAFT_2324480 [Lactarius deliciosus]
MGRTFSSTVTAAPVVISPGDSHDEIYPHYTHWSYENPWDPDSDAFFKDAVYEAVVSSIPLEPITPVDSSDDSSSASSGRGTPAELPPVPGQVLPSDHEVNRWLDGTSPSNDATAVLDGLPPLPTPRRHSTSEPRRRSTQSLGVSPAAFERFHARRLSRARVVQYLPAFVPDSDSDTDAPASVRPGVSVRTSDITPIQLPSSHHPRVCPDPRYDAERRCAAAFAPSQRIATHLQLVGQRIRCSACARVANCAVTHSRAPLHDGQCIDFGLVGTGEVLAR